ncbi:nucleotidyltransferase family protein [bacterium]|jgi:hypothetical protein|nr:hypothetical protein [Verrucomicrobiota bacterium]MDA7500169.1 nucleotidyltransferase family protein [bacterium]MDA7644852.1 nucleotidyltransferase family protein [bacterium]
MAQSGFESNIQTFVSASVVRGPSDWNWGADENVASAFLAVTEEMEVQSILHSLLAGCGVRNGWPAKVLDGLKSANLARFAGFELRLKEIEKVLLSLQQRGVDCVVLKGLPFALKFYEYPHHRPSSDTDVLIEHSALPIVDEMMFELGYEETPDMLYGTVSQQKQFFRTGKSGLEHVFDFHVELNNKPLLSPFSFDHFSNRSDVASLLGCQIRIPKNPEAFVLAALHRLGHLAKDRRFLWSFDLVRLALRLDRDEWRTIIELAEQFECRALLGDEINRLAGMAEDLVPKDVLDWAERCRHDRSEISGYYLGAERTRRSDLFVGIRTLPSAMLRIQTLGLLLFPRAQFMRDFYGGGQGGWLPYLYARRFVGIISKGIQEVR